MKKHKSIIGIIVTILVLFMACSFVYYNYEMKQAEKAGDANEKWSKNYKFPWRNPEFSSTRDYSYYHGLIQSSDLSDEDKLTESKQLWTKYHDWQQSQNNNSHSK